MMTVDDLIAGVTSRSRRALGKALSAVERGDSTGLELLRRLHPATGRAHLIGLTGSPGAGKSSLMQALIQQVRAAGASIAVLAVDPSSPISGGALLGDRVRMGSHGLDPNVFIRSLGSRGQYGGLSLATSLAARVLDAAGYDVVAIETVGVGQTELAIARTADTTVLVLNPETGDEVQASKAGIMEVADLFVINKADLPGAAAAKAYVDSVQAMAPAADWLPPVLLTRTQPQPQGIDSLWLALQQHRQYLIDSGELARRRAAHLRQDVQLRLEAEVRRFLDGALRAPEIWDPLVQAVIVERRLDPLDAATQVRRQLPWARLADDES